MTGADFQRADLWGSDLRGADLRLADLRGANLGSADLRGAHFAGADVRGARCNARTLWPEGFDPREGGAVLEDLPEKPAYRQPCEAYAGSPRRPLRQDLASAWH